MALVERKGSQVSSIRRLKLDTKNERLLIELATQKPGRRPEGREVAVRAFELNLSGRKWDQIEGQLLPHRLTARNKGRSIERQVQFLRAVLKRYSVPV